jgi:hypothetical protein
MPRIRPEDQAQTPVIHLEDRNASREPVKKSENPPSFSAEAARLNGSTR